MGEKKIIKKQGDIDFPFFFSPFSRTLEECPKQLVNKQTRYLASCQQAKKKFIEGKL